MHKLAPPIAALVSSRSPRVLIASALMVLLASRVAHADEAAASAEPNVQIEQPSSANLPSPDPNRSQNAPDERVGDERVSTKHPLLVLGYLGIAALGSSYVVAVVSVFASAQNPEGLYEVPQTSYSGWLFVPIVGPWLSLGDKGQTEHYLGGERAFTIAEGVIQDASAVAIAVGFLYKTQAHDVVSATGSRRPKSDWTIVPVAGRSPGMTLVATF
jgi:hypothetical protein